MLRLKKPITYKTLCAKIRAAETIDDLESVVQRANLKPLSFQVVTDGWLDVHPKELIVLETLVARLRELVEAGCPDGSDEDDPGPREPEYFW
jgi:hypothetical protein